MVILDFKTNEDVLKECLEEEIENVDMICFVTTFFLMPLRLCINGLELFEIDKDGWLPGPIISLASEGLSIIKELKITRKKEYQIIEGPGDFIFTMIDEKAVYVEFFGFSGNYKMNVKYEELLEAFKKFGEKVRAFLSERAPQINNHPYWGPWLRGEKD
jgi:hypothetical protein